MVSQFPDCPDWRDKIIVLSDVIIHVDIENDTFRSGFIHVENPFRIPSCQILLWKLINLQL